MIGASPIQNELRGPLMRAIAEFRKQPDIEVTVKEEFQMGPYRADFWIWARRPSTMNVMYCQTIYDYKPIAAVLVVEADGNAYHSSPDQLKHDHERDRYLFQHYAASTIRFTGREINGGPRRVSNLITQFLGYLLEECNESRLWTRELIDKRTLEMSKDPFWRTLSVWNSLAWLS